MVTVITADNNWWPYCSFDCDFKYYLQHTEHNTSTFKMHIQCHTQHIHMVSTFRTNQICLLAFWRHSGI